MRKRTTEHVWLLYLIGFATLIVALVWTQTSVRQLGDELKQTRADNAALAAQVRALGGKPVAEGKPGARGDQGPQGLPGPQGPPGIQGPRGPIGVTGQSPACLLEPSRCVGPKGAAGSQGEQGPQGPQGDTGATGAQGDQGVPGVDGKDGTDGRGIASVDIVTFDDKSCHLIVTYDDATKHDAGEVPCPAPPVDPPTGTGN